MESIAFYSGLFDPFTRGHLNIVIRTLREHDRIIIGVENSPFEKCDFSLEERIQMVTQTISDILKFKCGPVQFRKEIVKRIRENPEIVKVVPINGEVVDAAVCHRATAMIRGVRNDTDIHIEEEIKDRILLQFRIRNYSLKREDYKLMHTNDEVSHMSSTVAKNLCQRGEYIAALHHVTPGVLNMIVPRYLKPLFDKVFNDRILWDTLLTTYQNRGWHNFTQVSYLLNRLQIEKVLHQNHCNYEAVQRAMFINSLETDSFSQINGLASDMTLADARVLKRCHLLLLTDLENYSLYLRQVNAENDNTVAPGGYEQLKNVPDYLEHEGKGLLTPQEVELVKANVAALSQEQ